MRWRGATTYSYQVSTVSTFATTVGGQTGLTASSATVSLGGSGQYYWRACGANGNGSGPWSGIWSFSIPSSVLPSQEAAGAFKATAFSLTNEAITYAIPRAMPIEIVFYDILGRTVQVVYRTDAAGFHRIALRNVALASGEYIVRFKAGGFDRRQLLLLRPQ